MASPLSPDPQARKYQILIVEDEQIIAINLRESLEAIGYSVPAIAASAPKAIEYATHYRPHLVLMDIQLKGKPDGIEAAEKIWQMLQIPVIYVTGHSDQSTLDRAKVTAPFGYILKPIREKELYIAIETALQRYGREQLLVTSLEGMGNGVIGADAQNRVKFIKRELSLVNDLLDLQRINAETYPVDLTLVQIQHWIPHIIEPFVNQARTKQKTLQVEIAANLPTFQTDTHVLTRIVSELLQNACKYTPPNAGIKVMVEMLQFQTSLPHLHIKVCNSGIEIAADELSRIFDPFYRIPQRDCWAQGGTGLGLALVKKFVMHLGGSVVANSQDNQTRFSVYLPMHPPYSLT